MGIKIVGLGGPDRGSGKTTRAMQAAPKGAVFVWVNHHLDYPKALARHLGREDLKIVSPEWIEDHRWAGLDMTGLIRDPDTRFTDAQWDRWHAAKIRVRSQSDGGVEHDRSK
jgi:hypothetical protein